MPTYVIYYDQGNSPGPFNVYLSGSSGQTLYASNVTRPELEAGYLVNVPLGVPSSSIVVTNEAFGCANEEILPFPSPSLSVTPTPTITPSITPTRSISATVTPTVTPSRTLTPTVTPTRTVTPSVTLSVTPSPTIGASQSPTPTPTITRTPSITPSSPPPLVFTEFIGCGWGATAFDACNNAAYSPQSLWSLCNLGNFGVFCPLYTDSGGNLPLSNDGPLYVFINGGLWQFDSNYNWVSAYAFPQCS
jgi:hypothetical protein